MLGEDHSLLNEFPEHAGKIAELKGSDESFAKDYKEYDTLDAEIRKLELKNAPLEDNAMRDLKHRRRVLKDSLYQRLLSA